MNNSYHELFSEQEATSRFRRYVQRVAFQLTLSAPMIACLKYVRDDPGFSWTKNNEDRTNITALNTGACLYITEIKALERRGLTWRDEPKGKVKYPLGHKFEKLTKVGELTCELLVAAGMM